MSLFYSNRIFSVYTNSRNSSHTNARFKSTQSLSARKRHFTKTWTHDNKRRRHQWQFLIHRNLSNTTTLARDTGEATGGQHREGNR